MLCPKSLLKLINLIIFPKLGNCKFLQHCLKNQSEIKVWVFNNKTIAIEKVLQTHYK